MSKLNSRVFWLGRFLASNAEGYPTKLGRLTPVVISLCDLKIEMDFPFSEFAMLIGIFVVILDYIDGVTAVDYMCAYIHMYTAYMFFDIVVEVLHNRQASMRKIC